MAVRIPSRRHARTDLFFFSADEMESRRGPRPGNFVYPFLSFSVVSPATIRDGVSFSFPLSFHAASQVRVDPVSFFFFPRSRRRLLVPALDGTSSYVFSEW